MTNPNFFSNREICRGLFGFGVLALVLVGTACGTDAELSLETAGLDQSQQQIIGNNCQEKCDTVSETVEYNCRDEQYNCRDEQYNCSSYSVCSWWYCWTNTSCDTRQVCDSRRVCDYKTVEKQVNCRDECERDAFPAVDEQPLLRALNYWSTAEIQSNLGISAGLAAAVTQKRIDNGGVFFGLEEAAIHDFNPHAHKSNGAVAADQNRLMILAPAVSYNNKTTLLLDGKEQLDSLIALIDTATKYVHLNMMLFFDDPSGRAIAEALKRAAQRRVEVRVLFDYETTNLASSNRDSGVAVAGTPMNSGLGVRDIILSGCQSGVACDVRSTSQETEYWDNYSVPGYDHWYDLTTCWWGSCWTISTGERTHLANAGVPEYMLKMQDYIQDSVETHHNVVNHQKYMIVDGKNLALGSSNFGINYQFEQALDTSVKWRWHDGFSIIEGPMAKRAQRIFAQQWFVNARGDIFDFESSFYFPADSELISPTGTAPMALLQSFPGDPVHLNIRYIQEMVQNATDQVYIENPYVTDNDLWSAIDSLDSTRASRLNFVTSMSMTDSPVNGAAVRCGGYKSADRGAKYYDYYDAELFSHLKLAVDTGKNMVHYGSYNLNMRSKRHDLELNFLTRDPTLMQRARDVIVDDINKSTIKPLNFFHESTTWETECYFEEATNWFS